MHCPKSKNRTALAAAAAAVAAPGCSGIQSALDPAGPQAASLAQLTWAMSGAAAAILTVVMALAWYAVYRHPDKRRPVSSTTLIVAGGIAFPVVVLSALLAYGVGLTGALRGSDAQDSLHVHVTGHTWWWEVRYAGGEGEAVASANEIRIPVGRSIAFTFSSNDVIHSFWVPSLGGKVDLIPGRLTRLNLQADRAGTYRGQCAEFCGAQHALMALHVVALEPDEFERWLENQRRGARSPVDEKAKTGKAAFLAQGCGNCHTVRGVSRSRVAAPDLTHVASRAWLGAGTLPNTRSHAITWLAQGEAVKPGRAMPSFGHLDDATLGALADYLGGLH